MSDIDKSVYDRKRYFACLGMLMMELDDLSDSFLIRGVTLKKLLYKYNMDVLADKKRVRVQLLLPVEANSDEYVKQFHKAVLLGVRDYRKKINHYKAVANDKNRK